MEDPRPDRAEAPGTPREDEAGTLGASDGLHYRCAIAGGRGRWLDRLNVLSKLVLGLATFGLSWTVYSYTVESNREAARRQVQAQGEAIAAARRSAAVQTLAGQLPAILHGTDQERAVALGLIEAIDPELVREIGERLLARAPTDEAKTQARRIIASSEEAGWKQSFATHLDNAGKYREFGLDPAAAREYLKAYEVLPSPVAAEVRASINNAKAAYERGEFTVSARLFEAALRRVEVRIR